VKEASSLVFFSGLLILTGISRCRDAGFAIRYLNCWDCWFWYPLFKCV